ncbi:MAG TPA: AMP-binding protein [Beijerinckiaceae bacterium]|nr:AMP-binding protein [Beijerinckiaceae bacterium]
MLLPDIRDYDRLYRSFRWDIPARFNIATSVCDVWAERDGDRPAIIEVPVSGDVRITSYRQMREQSNRLANALVRHGIAAGDRVAILLPQSAAVPVAHLAVYRMGAIALPLAVLFGVDALQYRLTNAGARVLITDAAGVGKIAAIRGALPGLELILSVDGDDGAAIGLDRFVAGAGADFPTAPTGPDDPALMIYTSGTTGQPKGALHAHRVLLGHMPGVQWPHEFMPQPGDRVWTPADWAWIGGLMNVLMTSLACGVPAVAHVFEKFDPEAAFAFMAQHQVRNTFIAPTALRMLRTVARPRERFGISLRTLASGGETLGEEVYAWGRQELSLTINEFYGQTECNLIAASCAAGGVSRSGSLGKAVPGHVVGIIREDGTPCAVGEIGIIAARRPDPAMFLEYWGQPEATRAKFIGDWMKTGDQGRFDEDGYIFFVGRDDDVITSSGYRIGPGEIEDCLISHPKVAIAAVVGKPDPVRTEIVKAFVVLKPGIAGDETLRRDIQSYVRTRLSAHEYPREIEFVDSLPLTTTGKIIRRLLREQR